jgi:hypothetical protein
MGLKNNPEHKRHVIEEKHFWLFFFNYMPFCCRKNITKPGNCQENRAFALVCMLFLVVVSMLLC